MSFSFPKEFKTETGGGFMNFKPGANKFRIMSEPIFGQVYWKTTEDGKRMPVRLKLNETVNASDLEVGEDGKPERVNQFMAVVVYNHAEGMYQTLEITQKTVNAGIKALIEDKDWGDPTQYDITVTKTGSGRFDTKYTVMPAPKKELSDTILEVYKEIDINLNDLFKGVKPATNKENVKADSIPF